LIVSLACVSELARHKQARLTKSWLCLCWRYLHVVMDAGAGFDPGDSAVVFVVGGFSLDLWSMPLTHPWLSGQPLVEARVRGRHCSDSQ
jgi:hypothetical protein